MMRARTLYLAVIGICSLPLACNNKHTDWIPQYPDSYKPMYKAELVYADSDSKNCTNPHIIWAINDICVTDSDGVWAIKDWGTMLYSRDGRNFRTMQSPAVYQLNTMKAVKNEVWAVGCNGDIIHFKNGKWNSEGKGLTKKDIWALWLNATGSEAWAVGNEGLIMHDSTGTWRVVQCGITDVFIHDVWMKPDGSEGWAVGNEGTILHYVSGKWANATHDNAFGTSLNSADLMKIWMNPEGNEGWTVGDHGAILHYKAGAWTREASAIEDCQWNKIVMKPDGSAGWAVGSGGEALRYQDGQWIDIPGIARSEYFKSVFSDEKNFWVTGGEGIYHSTDNKNMTKCVNSFGHNIYECIAGNNDALWVGCWDDVILRLSAVPGATYPTLANIKYHVPPAKRSEDAIISIDFQLSAKSGAIQQFLPIEFSLKGKQKDSTNYQDIRCKFVRSDTSISSGIWTAKFSLRQFNVDIDKKDNNRLYLKLTFHTANANEDVIYDIKEGTNDYLTVE